MAEHLLEMQHISIAFSGIPANDDVDFDVDRGEIHALLGENGAGKTTLMNILYGIYTHYSGQILWEGAPVRFHAPKDAIDRRIGMVHQHFTLVPNLTVSENITLGLHSKGHPFTDRKYVNAQLLALCERYGLTIDPDAIVSTLSVGEQQRVEILKLLYRDVQLLILDEPTAVLTPGEVEVFFRVLDRLRSDGRAIVIITHHIPEVMEIADRVTVLRDAKRIATMTRAELTEELLSRCMIGRQLHLAERTPCRAQDEPGLSLEGVTVEHRRMTALDHVDLRVRPGEILGIAGVDGNGQKQLAEAIVGIRPYKGHISLFGQSLDGLSVNERKGLGIGYVSDDRLRDGLIMDMSVSENMLLRSEKGEWLRNGFLRRNRVREAAEQTVSRFSIKAASLSAPVRNLSGGNQQKLILGREIYDGVRLIIAHQPTRGLDIGASETIRELLVSCRDEGCCVLLISADLEEIFSISDRVAVIHGGTIMGVFDNDENVDMTSVGLMMAGTRAVSGGGEGAEGDEK
ncbi:MAG: ABC transporter ATP-binding protein [Oscillibacter sp.]|nr:ABC transporter ATP-binding protein [Oscillibacter sp.]